MGLWHDLWDDLWVYLWELFLELLGYFGTMDIMGLWIFLGDSYGMIWVNYNELTTSEPWKSWFILRESSPNGFRWDGARWCPSSLAKLVNITPISLWFMVDITIVFMGFINQQTSLGGTILWDSYGIMA